MNEQYILKDGELYHHGIKGQKWRVRRFQNKDGSLTSAGRKRYLKGAKTTIKKLERAYDRGFDWVENKIGKQNMRYARDGMAYLSAALWVASEFSILANTPISAVAAVTNMASIVIDPDD